MGGENICQSTSKQPISSRKAVEKLWKSCRKAVEKLWKSCGKAVNYVYCYREGEALRGGASKDQQRVLLTEREGTLSFNAQSVLCTFCTA